MRASLEKIKPPQSWLVIEYSFSKWWLEAVQTKIKKVQTMQENKKHLDWTHSIVGSRTLHITVIQSEHQI